MSEGNDVAFSIDLEAIAPREGEKYFPLLYAYLKTLEPATLAQQGVTRDGQGHLWLGYPDGHWFVGLRFLRVLVLGERSGIERAAYANVPSEALAGFWPAYQRQGRCLIDPAHALPVLPPIAWEASAGERKCPWCGHTQRLHRFVKTITHTEWRPV